jgi:hypothetical protein
MKNEEFLGPKNLGPCAAARATLPWARAWIGPVPVGAGTKPFSYS